jgi:hypothetical protein
MTHLKILLFGFCFIIFFVISGCLPTTISSMKDPTIKGRTYKRILIISQFDKIELIRDYELNLAKELSEKGIYAVANYTVLPPLREYTNEEKDEVMSEHKFDSYLLLIPQGYDIRTEYYPPSTETETRVSKHDSTLFKKTTTTSYPGGYEETPTAFFAQVKMYDFKNGNIIWQGDTETKLSTYMTDHNISKWVCKKIAEQLEADAMIISKKN